MEAYNKLINEYFDQFIREFGEKKMRSITLKIKSSNKIKNFLLQLSIRAPFKEDIIYPVMSIPYFMIAKKTTAIMGCLLALQLWNESYNKNEELLKDYEIHELALSIIFHLRDI
jgi:hypothetical protein